MANTASRIRHSRNRRAVGRTLIVLIGLVGLTVSAASAQPSPGTPSNVAVTQVGTRLQVTWAAPASGPTNAPPEGYLVTFHAGPASTISSSTVVASQRTGTETGLSVDIPAGVTGTYTVVVAGFAGTGISGLGAASAPVTFTLGGGGNCSGPPTVPANVQATRSALVRLTWTASPGASNYRVLAQVPPANTTIFDGLVGSVPDVSGAVAPATPLLLSVSAINACGQSAFSPAFSLPPAGQPVLCAQDAQTMCLFSRRFTVRLTVQPPGGVARPVDVLRRFNDGGSFGFASGTNVEDLFMRIEDRCATQGVYVVSFDNRSAFSTGTGFELFVGDNRGSISRTYAHAPGTPFVSFQDSQSFVSCP